MFASDKELKRASTKSSSTKTKHSQDKSDVVERARKERVERQINRETSIHVIVIQSWWRGRRDAFRFIQSQKLLFDRKITDIENLGKVLMTTRKIILIPPRNICCELTKYLTCGEFGTSDANRVYRFCKSVLLLSLSEMDAEKNMVVGLNSVNCMKLCCYIISTITQYTRNMQVSDVSEVLLASLSALLGMGASFKMTFATIIENNFIKIRHQLCSPSIPLTLYTKKALRFDLTKFSGATLTSNMRAKQYINLFQITHMLGCMFSDIEFINKIDENSDIQHQYLASVESFKCHKSVDALIRICLSLLDKERSSKHTSLLDAEFIREVFSIPCITCLIPLATMKFLISSLDVNVMIHMLGSDRVALPPSHVRGITTGQWLLGNMAHLFSQLPIHLNCSKEQIPDDILIAYINMLLSLLVRYHIPGVFQGKAGVLWERQGVTLSASGVPPALQHQLLQLLEISLLQALYARVLAPLDQNLNSFHVDDKYRTEIAEALNSTGLKMARDVIEEQKVIASSWFSSKWASKLLTSVKETFGMSDNSQSTGVSATRAAMDMKQAANDIVLKDEDSATAYHLNLNLVAAVGRLWSILFSQAVLARVDSRPWRYVSAFCFSKPSLPAKLWTAVLMLNGKGLINNFRCEDHMNHPAFYSGNHNNQRNDCSSCVGIVVTLAAVLRTTLIALDDDELYSQGKPLPLIQLFNVVNVYKAILYSFVTTDPDLLLCGDHISENGNAFSNNLIENKEVLLSSIVSSYKQCAIRSISSVLSDLYSRWARKPFSYATLWEIDDASSSKMKLAVRNRTNVGCALLKFQPWGLSFHERMKIFRDVVDGERIRIQGLDDVNSGQRSRGTIVRVRRQRLLADGMDALSHVGSAIKDRIVVRYINNYGEEESGIDMGGLFKDFWTDLSSKVFDPSFGLFCVTSSQLLYPNPNAKLLFDDNDIETTYEFLGRILGKAMFENLTVQPQFAHFFLAFMNGRYNFTGLINDLTTLDADLYKNLMWLKAYEGDISDLSLTFSVTDDTFGSHKEVDIIPGGANIAVTSDNRYRYISAVAKYYLHDRIKSQARAFFNGLYYIISPELLGMFCAPELQILISGALSSISVDDLKANCQYKGGFTGLDKRIGWFWNILQDMSDADKSLLIKFVTSCERPPSLGFGSLNPPFAIQRVESSDDSRLPSASTCFNTLKLPTYSSQRIMSEKLLTAIRSNSGFELT